MFSRDDKYVNWSLWIDILKSNYFVILINKIRRDFVGDDNLHDAQSCDTAISR